MLVLLIYNKYHLKIHLHINLYILMKNKSNCFHTKEKANFDIYLNVLDLDLIIMTFIII